MFCVKHVYKKCQAVVRNVAQCLKTNLFQYDIRNYT